MMNPEQVAKSWRDFLINAAFARNYPIFNQLTSVRGAPRNPILDDFLPSLLQIKAVTVLDAALRLKLAEANERPKTHGFRNDLHGRIETALRVGMIKDVTLLHRARDSRNDVAHEFAEKLAWPRLEADIVVIQEALQEMEFVRPRPDLKVKGERVPKKALKNPKAVFGFDYRVWACVDDSVWADITWSEEILGDGDE